MNCYSLHANTDDSRGVSEGNVVRTCGRFATAFVDAKRQDKGRVVQSLCKMKDSIKM